MVQNEPRKCGKQKFLHKTMSLMLELKNIIKFQLDLWCTEIEEEIRQLIKWNLFCL